MKKITILQIVLILLLFFLASIDLNAQLKVGMNPKTLSSNIYFEVESVQGNKFIITKDSANVGIGTSSPTAKFEINNGSIPGAIKIIDGTEGEGKVLTSDASGLGVWNTPSVNTTNVTNSKSITNSNGIIVTGGTGATLQNTSLRLDSVAIAKMINQSPIKDSLLKVINSNTTIGSTFNVSTRVLTTTVNGVTSSVTISTANDSTTASNGLTLNGKDVRLGGTLTGATTIATGATNTIALTGLQTGSDGDSLVSLGVNGVLRKLVNITRANTTASNNLVTVANGTNATFTAMTVGVDTTNLKSFLNNKITVTSSAPLSGNGTSGSPISLTTNNTTAGQLVTVTNGTGATMTNMQVSVDTTALKTFMNGRTTVSNAFNTSTRALTTTVNGITGSSVTISTANDSTTASNGLTLNGKDVRLGGTLTGATTIATGATNTIALTGLQTGSDGDSLVSLGANGVLRKLVNITRANTTAANNLVTVNNGTNATFTAMTVGVDTTNLKSFLNNKITVTSSAPLSGNGTSASPLTLATNNTTAGQLVTVTNGTGATMTNMQVSVDTTALKTFMNGRTTVSNAFNTSTRALTTTVNGITGSSVTISTANDSTTASNGLTLNGKDVRLGGTLTGATTIATGATNTIALTGLQTGSDGDSLVSLGANGVLRKLVNITRANTTASNNLVTVANGTNATFTAMTVGVDTTNLKSFLNNKITVTSSAPLSGNGTSASPLTLATNNTTAGQLVTVTNGTGATMTNMQVSVDTTALKTFMNGRTTVSNAFNTSTRALTTTVNGITGSSVTISTANDSTTASNGLTLNGKDVRLGGTLTGATTIATGATNTIALTGLQTGSDGDSLVSLGVNGVLRKLVNITRANTTASNNLVTVANGTNATFTAMTVGVDTTNLKSFLNNKITVTSSAPLSGNGTSGSPLSLTTNNTTAGQLVTVTNGTGATMTNMQVSVDTTALKTFMNGRTTVSNAFNTSTRALTTTVNGITGSSVTISTANDSTTASNGLTLNGKDVRLGGTLTGATTIATGAMNTIALTGLQTGSDGDSLVSLGVNGVLRKLVNITRANTTASNNLVTVANGTNATFTAMTVGVDTTNLKSFLNNKITVTSSAPLSGNGTSASPLTLATNNTTAGQLVTVTNGTGATMTNMQVSVDTTALKTFMNGRTTVSNAFNTSTRALTTTVNGITGSSVTISTANDSTTASNGLTLNGKDVRLGGTLTGATTIATGATNTIALTGLQTGSDGDSLVSLGVNGVLRKLVNITRANTTASNNLVTVANGTNATFTAMTVGVDTTNLKSFLNNKITVTSSAPLSGNGTSASPLTLATNNTTAGQLVTVTNGTGASLTNMQVSVDTTALKTFMNGRTTVSNAFNTSTRALTTTVNGITGSSVTISTANDSTTASNGLTLNGKDVRLGGTLNSATTISQGTNLMTYTGSPGSANSSMISIQNTATGSNGTVLLDMLTPNSDVSNYRLGKATTLGNSSEITFRTIGNNSDSNSLSLGFFGSQYLVNLTKKGNLGIGSNLFVPTQKLDVDGGVRIRSLGTGASTDSVVTVDANGVLRIRNLLSIGSANQLSVSLSATVPALSIGDPGSVTITVTGAAEGDGVIVNPNSDLPVGVVIAYSRVSAANTVKIGFTGTGSSSSFAQIFDIKVIK